MTNWKKETQIGSATYMVKIKTRFMNVLVQDVFLSRLKFLVRKNLFENELELGLKNQCDSKHDFSIRFANFLL